jgi:hypothetical protein
MIHAENLGKSQNDSSKKEARGKPEIHLKVMLGRWERLPRSAVPVVLLGASVAVVLVGASVTFSRISLPNIRRLI